MRYVVCATRRTRHNTHNTHNTQRGENMTKRYGEHDVIYRYGDDDDDHHRHATVHTECTDATRVGDDHIDCCGFDGDLFWDAIARALNVDDVTLIGDDYPDDEHVMTARHAIIISTNARYYDA